MTADTFAQGIIESLRYQREEIAARRAAVLAHPDLAARLTREPIGYARADQWNGYIPPETYNGSHNRSPRRTALLELVTEARARDAKGTPA